MSKRRTHRTRLSFAAWLALVAVWAMALVPTVSHALAAARGDASWTLVCSAQGTRLVAVDMDSDEPAPANVAGTMEHCLYCAASFSAAPPPAAPALAVAAPAHVLPALFFVAPRTLHAWLSAQPRAPPLFI
ncbi:MAG: DUF2946 domain-containing protein [Betaproteobacteria bacterium]|jgi:hypothetical protein|nr:DUF2946 domain-containing protein [Betaproteobacteria bacterium]MCC6247649.1 DUF2946 domain-containing protein [Rubrivivax sp.]MCL4697986.1 DUF2946 family protein [Burkholderiaceae bacterium]